MVVDGVLVPAIDSHRSFAQWLIARNLLRFDVDNQDKAPKYPHSQQV